MNLLALVAVGLVVWWLARSPGVTLRGPTQTVVPQLPGAAGIVQTMGLMRAMANSAIDHPLIRQYAARATEPVPKGDSKSAAVAIGEWVRGAVRYLPDPLHKENVTNPSVMIEAVHAGKKVFGDCDDMAMLVAAMGKSIGMQPTFHGVGRGARYHHIYTELAGVPVDPTVSMGTKPFRAERELRLKV